MGVIALLECGHYVEFGAYTKVPNPTGPDEMCPECKTAQLINNEWPERWHAICQTPLCPYHTRHGMSKRYAQESRENHFARTGHRCAVLWYSDAPTEAKREVRSRRRERKTERLSESFPESPPF